MMGVIQRMIRFQLSLTFTGMTGWMFNTSCVRYPGLIPMLLLFCTGTLMRLATGFCAAFRNASALAAAAGVSCVATSVPVASTGVSSCAISGTVNTRKTASASRLRLTKPSSTLTNRLAEHFIGTSHVRIIGVLSGNVQLLTDSIHNDAVYVVCPVRQAGEANGQVHGILGIVHVGSDLET